MSTLILIRHGESVWNSEGLFTGWVDVGLSPKGVDEAVNCGRLLDEAGREHRRGVQGSFLEGLLGNTNRAGGVGYNCV